MWIECACGEKHMIAKHFGGAWEVRAFADGQIHPELLAEQLDKWFMEHVTCGGEPFDGTHFKLVYEHHAGE
jgi:hypothetical protein